MRLRPRISSETWQHSRRAIERPRRSERQVNSQSEKQRIENQSTNARRADSD